MKNSMHLRQMLDQIKKMAEDPPDPPDLPVDPDANLPTDPSLRPQINLPPVNITNKPAGNKSIASPDIKGMQLAIQALSAILRSKPILFNFIKDHYDAKINSDILSVGVDPKNPRQKPAKLFADGVWGALTNKQLFNIDDFAASFINMQKDFPLQYNQQLSFSKDDWNNMDAETPEDEDLKITRDLARRAKALTELINKLNEDYQSYSKYLEKNEDFKKMTDKSSAILAVGPAKSDMPEAKDYKYLNSNKIDDVILPDVHGQGVSVGPLLIQLSSPKLFKDFILEKLQYSEESFKQNQ